jgi:hypothetical protein
MSARHWESCAILNEKVSRVSSRAKLAECLGNSVSRFLANVLDASRIEIDD